MAYVKKHMTLCLNARLSLCQKKKKKGERATPSGLLGSRVQSRPFETGRHLSEFKTHGDRPSNSTSSSPRGGGLLNEYKLGYNHTVEYLVDIFKSHKLYLRI